MSTAGQLSAEVKGAYTLFHATPARATTAHPEWDHESAEHIAFGLVGRHVCALMPKAMSNKGYIIQRDGPLSVSYLCKTFKHINDTPDSLSYDFKQS